MTSEDQYQLVILTEPNIGDIIPLETDNFIIGREITCDLTLLNHEISRNHAQITRTDEGFILEDLGSTNGTYAGGFRLSTPYTLKEGDTLILGNKIKLRFEKYVEPTEEPVSLAAPIKETTEEADEPTIIEEVIFREPPKDRSCLWAGMGCFAVIVVVFVLISVAFDTMDLYCTPPFNEVFSFLWSCP